MKRWRNAYPPSFFVCCLSTTIPVFLSIIMELEVTDAPTTTTTSTAMVLYVFSLAIKGDTWMLI
jgi:hypothetical protein